MVLSIIIIMFLALGVIIGAKRGVIYQLVKMVSAIVVVVLSLLLKNFVAHIFLNHFNFIDLDPSLSIILYRGIAFIILCFIFRILIRLLLKLSKRFEKLLDKTIILGIPSRILGGLLGFIEYYIYTVIILAILSIPIFEINTLDSGVARFILNKVPRISRIDSHFFSELQNIYNKCGNKCGDEYTKLLEHYDITIEN